MQYNFSNDEFNYRIFYPDGPDKLLVSFYCEVSFAATSKEPVLREILPYPGCELSFYFDGLVSYQDGDNNIPLYTPNLAGQPSATRSLLIQPGTNIFFIRFRQHFLKSFLHDSSVWRDTIFQPRDKFSQPLSDRIDAITGQNSFEERIILAQQAVAAIMETEPDKNFHWLQQVEPALLNHQSVQELSRLTHTETRQLQRKFNSYFDLSPKDYLRLLKLSDALDHYARNADSSVTEASYEGGFADQAHFIKTFRLFSTDAPLKFFRKFNIKKK